MATEHDGSLALLDCWEARVNSAGCLEIKGAPLAQEIWEQDRWQRITQNGWFTTTDLVELDGRNLRWLGRADSVVKILGELVNLDTVQQTLTKLAGGEIVVLAMSDARQGHRLYANVTESVRATYDETCPPFARLSGTFPSELIVRSALGKPQRQATQQAVNAWLSRNTDAPPM